MLNKLWGIIIIGGVIYAAFTGKLSNIGTASLDSAKEAVSLCITMVGVMSLWTGLMNVAKEAGIIDGLTRGLSPVIRFLFPKLTDKSKAKEYIASNMIANMLGLGWAATPMGLKAMERMKSDDTGIATNEMCTF